jgi:hypothetical protein
MPLTRAECDIDRDGETRAAATGLSRGEPAPRGEFGGLLILSPPSAVSGDAVRAAGSTGTTDVTGDEVRDEDVGGDERPIGAAVRSPTLRLRVRTRRETGETDVLSDALVRRRRVGSARGWRRSSSSCAARACARLRGDCCARRSASSWLACGAAPSLPPSTPRLARADATLVCCFGDGARVVRRCRLGWSYCTCPPALFLCAARGDESFDGEIFFAGDVFLDGVFDGEESSHPPVTDIGDFLPPSENASDVAAAAFFRREPGRETSCDSVLLLPRDGGRAAYAAR